MTPNPRAIPDRGEAGKLVRAGLLIVVVSLAACGKPESGKVAEELSLSEKNYLQEIEITSARMMAASNFLGQQVFTLDAAVINHGPRTVRSLQVELKFMDIEKRKVVLDKTVKIVTPASPLNPHETRTFSVSLDQMPDEWNEGPPRIIPVGLSF